MADSRAMISASSGCKITFMYVPFISEDMEDMLRTDWLSPTVGLKHTLHGTYLLGNGERMKSGSPLCR